MIIYKKQGTNLNLKEWIIKKIDLNLCELFNGH